MKKIFAFLFASTLIFGVHAQMEVVSPIQWQKAEKTQVEKPIQKTQKTAKPAVTQTATTISTNKAAKAPVQKIVTVQQMREKKQYVGQVEISKQATLHQSTTGQYDATTTQKFKRAIEFNNKHNILPPAQIAQVQMMNAKKTRRKVSQAATNVEIGLVSTYYDSEESRIRYFFVSKDEALEFQFLINLPSDQTDVELGKTYTLSNMVSYATWTRQPSVDLDSHWNSQVSFVKTVTDNVEHYETTVVSDLGEFSFSYDYQPDVFVPTGDTIAINFTSSAYSYSFTDSYVEWIVYNEEYFLSLEFNTLSGTTPSGIYTEDALGSVWYNYLRNQQDKQSVQFISAKFEVTETDDRIDIKGNFLCTDGNVYFITTFYEPVKPTAFKDLTANNLTISDIYASSFSIIEMGANNETDSIWLTFQSMYAKSYLPGTYNIGSLVFGDVFDAEGAHELLNGTIVVAKNGNDWAVTGKVVADNLVEYTLNLTYTMPEPVKKDLSIENLSLELNAYAWQVTGTNTAQTYEVSLYAFGTPGTPANLTETYMVYEYTFICDKTTNVYYTLLSANLNVVLEENNIITITGTYLGQNAMDPYDVIEFNLTLTAKQVPPTEAHYPFDVSDAPLFETFSTYDIDFSYYYNYGAMLVTAKNENNASVALSVVPAEGYVALVPGVYTINKSQSAMTVISGYTSSNGEIYNSFAGYVNSNQQFYSLWLIVDGTLTVNEDGSMIVDAKNSYNQIVRLRFDAPIVPLEFDSKDNNFIHDFVSYEEIDDYFEIYDGLVYIQYMDDDYLVTLSMTTDVTPLLPGTYPINYTGDINTVTASKGYDEGFYPSLVAKMSEDSDYEEVWFLVSGKVIVGEDGVITIDAVNSYGKKVYVTMGAAPATDVVNVTISDYYYIFYSEDKDVYYTLMNTDQSIRMRFDFLLENNQTDIALGQTYTESNLDTRYSYMEDDNRGLGEYTSVLFTKTLNSEGRDHIEATIVTDNGFTYLFNYDDREVLPNGDTIAVDFASTDIYLEEDGSVMWLGSSDDYEVVLTYYTDVVGDIEGTYTEDNCDKSYSYVADKKNNLSKMLVKADIEVVTVAGGYQLHAYVLVNTGVVYDVTMLYSTSMQYDTNDDFEHNFDSYQTYNATSEYGLVEVYYESEEYMVDIYFVTDTYPLKAGVYPITYNNENNTVAASYGYDEEGFYPSLVFAFVPGTTSGYPWYMVDGNVTVTTDGVIIVDAINSYGRSIKCTLGATTAIENHNGNGQKTVKYIDGGQLLIQTSTSIYNAQGMKIK